MTRTREFDFARLGRTVAEEQDAHAASREEAPIAQRMEALRRQQVQLRQRRGRWSWAATGLAAVAVCLAAVFSWVRPEPALEFYVEGSDTRGSGTGVSGTGVSGTRGTPGDWIAAESGESTAVHFSDGSRLEWAARSRGRVLSVSARGARVALEDGALEVSVEHREGTEWSVVAGPFEVHVTGTRFSTHWEPSDQTLRLSMHEGSVLVSGACLEVPRAFRAGQSASLTCAEPMRLGAMPPDTGEARPAQVVATETVTRPAPAAEGPAEGAEEGPAEGPAEGARTASSPVASGEPTPPSRERAWAAALRAGRLADALKAAEAEGFEAALRQATEREALQLADAARLAGRSELARAGYLAVRRHHGGSESAATAAFQLGRLGHGSPREWYELALRERPRGVYAGEILGRLLELQVAGKEPSAESTARRYLQSFPAGPHRQLAEQVLARSEGARKEAAGAGTSEAKRP